MNQSSTGSVHLSILESGVAVITLGDPSERVITLTPSRIKSLADTLLSLKASPPRGLIITGPSLEMFTVGADISIIQSVKDPAEGQALAKQGQDVFQLIEDLPCITVAAISGPCVGGGCELALACRYRIMSDDKSSLIGLPETKLGILPGFGGTQRLPRLIGLPKALDIILAGKTLRPRQAQNYGLVNEVIQSTRLLERAESIASKNSTTKEIAPNFVDRLLTFTKLGRAFLKNKVKKSIRKETKGFYPAPPAALECCLYGLEHGLSLGYTHEAKELGRLIVSPESKALVNVFFLSENAKSLGKSGKKFIESLNAVVIGAGTMGAGIAGSLARAGFPVVLKDVSDAALTKGKEHIQKSLQKIKYLSETEKSFILNRVETTSRDLTNGSSIGLALEAVYEDLSLKTKLLGDIATHIPSDAIIATNTSSLSVSKIAATIEHPERVVGMHFFNPVEKMPLIEIVMGESTSDKTLSIIAALTSKLGKYPIIVKDVPGFLVNRILSPYLNEAAFLLQEGYSIEDIDTAATKFGMPMGPIRLLDEVGLDVAAHVSEIMVAGYGERMKAPTYAKTLASHGKLGRKSGSGFYDFSHEKISPSPIARELLKLPKATKEVTNINPLQERLIMSLLNEAVKCLDEGVAGQPGKDAASQINLGTVMGMGFPPFRGGLLYFADTLGAKNILEGMQKMEREHGARFTPAQGIIERAGNNQSFCS